LLQLDGCRSERPHADVLIHGRGPRLDDRGSGEHGSRHVAEVTTAGTTGEAIARFPLELLENPLDRPSVLRQGFVEPCTQFRGVECDSGIRRRFERQPEALSEIVHR
jgi:hypothetical protein